MSAAGQIGVVLREAQAVLREVLPLLAAMSEGRATAEQVGRVADMLEELPRQMARWLAECESARAALEAGGERIALHEYLGLVQVLDQVEAAAERLGGPGHAARA